MARTPKNLASAQLATTVLTQIYIAPDGTNTNGSVLAFTNVTTTPMVISIYRGLLLMKALTLPGGVGQERIYYGFQSRVINAAQTISIQSDSATAFNYDLSGSEVEV